MGGKEPRRKDWDAKNACMNLPRTTPERSLYVQLYRDAVHSVVTHAQDVHIAD